MPTDITVYQDIVVAEIMDIKYEAEGHQGRGALLKCGGERSVIYD
jgi:hypothetical protein